MQNNQVDEHESSFLTFISHSRSFYHVTQLWIFRQLQKKLMFESIDCTAQHEAKLQNKIHLFRICSLTLIWTSDICRMITLNNNSNNNDLIGLSSNKH